MPRGYNECPRRFIMFRCIDNFNFHRLENTYAILDYFRHAHTNFNSF